MIANKNLNHIKEDPEERMDYSASAQQNGSMPNSKKSPFSPRRCEDSSPVDYKVNPFFGSINPLLNMD